MGRRGFAIIYAMISVVCEIVALIRWDFRRFNQPKQKSLIDRLDKLKKPNGYYVGGSY